MKTPILQKYKASIKAYPEYTSFEVHVLPCEKQPPVTLENIEKYITNVSDLSKPEIKNLSSILISRFGYSGRILDNCISTEERKYFNAAEEMGLVIRNTEDGKFRKEKPWRVFYWILNKTKIHEMKDFKIETENNTYQELYSSISEEDWEKHSN